MRLIHLPEIALLVAGLATGFIGGWVTHGPHAYIIPDNRLPAWVYQFAIDFCGRRIDQMSPRFGPTMRTASRNEMVAWLARNSDCYRVEYLDNARLGPLDRYVFIMDAVDGRHWWVISVDRATDLVVDID